MIHVEFLFNIIKIFINLVQQIPQPIPMLQTKASTESNYNPPDWPLTISYSHFLLIILDDHEVYRQSSACALDEYGIDVYAIRDPLRVCRTLSPEVIARRYKAAIKNSNLRFARHPGTPKAKAADYYRDCLGLVLDALNKVYGKRFGKVVTSTTRYTPHHDYLIYKYKNLGVNSPAHA